MMPIVGQFDALAVAGAALLAFGLIVLFKLAGGGRKGRRRRRALTMVRIGAHYEPSEPLPVIRFDEDDDEGTRCDDLESSDESCPAIPIAFDDSALVDEDTAIEPHFLVHAVSRTDRGRKREHNEDTVLVSRAAGLCVVADGMGGHAGGGVASEIAAQTIVKALEEKTFEGKPHPTLPPRGSEVVRAIQMASSRIREVALEKPELSRMGTTVVAARFSPDKRRLYVGHVGDSRCYRFRDGVLHLMTKDHTMACFGVVGSGAGLLSRAVGPRPRVLTDLVIATPRVGDVYLLCSDGLTKMVSDDVIRDVLDTVVDEKRAADWLVELANVRGGLDNISVVLVRVAASEQAAA